MDRYITADEAAQLLNISPKTLRKLAAAGVVRGHRLGRMWRFDRHALLPQDYNVSRCPSAETAPQQRQKGTDKCLSSDAGNNGTLTSPIRTAAELGKVLEQLIGSKRRNTTIG